MPTPEAEAHITAQERLRALTVTGVAAAWDRLPNYDEESLAPFLAIVVPLVLAAQRHAAAVTNAFLARAVGRQPIGFDVSKVIGPAIRSATPAVIESAGLPDGTKGVPPDIVYRRPFVQTWAALSDRTPWVDAVAAGRERATGTAAMDVQNAMRHTLRLVGEQDDLILGYRRVPDSDACPFCKIIAGRRYLTSDLMEVHPRCVTGDTMVWASGDPLAPPRRAAEATDFGAAHAATRRRYEGEIVVLKTASGYDLTVTPNHPILTDRGWVDAGLLREGDSVISSLRSDGVVGGVPDEENMPARIEEHFRTDGVTPLLRVPFASEHFHGDAGDGQVDVVGADCRLDAWMLAALTQPLDKNRLRRGLRQRLGFPCACGRREHRGAVRASALRHVGGPRSGLAFNDSLPRCGDDVLHGSCPFGDPRLAQVAVDHGPGYAEAVRQLQYGCASDIGVHDAFKADAPATGQWLGTNKATAAKFAAERREADTDSARGLLLRLAGQVHADRIVKASAFDWCGDVFNLVTRGGWYTANGIVTHNCGCSVDVITAANRGDFTGKLENDLRITRDGVTAAVVEHGELGSLLVDGDDHFAGPEALAA